MKEGQERLFAYLFTMQTLEMPEMRGEKGKFRGGRGREKERTLTNSGRREPGKQGPFERLQGGVCGSCDKDPSEVKDVDLRSCC
jgi:hypothetical protein